MKKKFQNINEQMIEKIYDKIASAYENHRVYEPNQWDLVEYPKIQKITDDLNNKVILDAGCGTGIFIKEITKNFSIKEVIGIDISQEMLKIAKKRCKSLHNVKLSHSSICKTPFRSNYFDIIYCFGVLHYIENIVDVLREFKRILRKDGNLVFSIKHPIRNLSYIAKEGGKDYFYRGWHKERWAGSDDVDVYNYYRPLEDWINTIVDCGFRIEAIHESKPEKNIKISYPDFYDKYTRIPRELLFVTIKA